MATNFELQAEIREQFGSAVSRRMRRKNGRVPAIVYGGGQAPQPIVLSHDAVIVALGYQAFYSNIVSLSIEGEAQQVILKALQRHPYKNKVLHLDFLRVKANEKLTVKIPVQLKGAEDAPGVKEQGGVITHHCNEIEVRCFPKDLPESIEIDVSALKLDDVLHLSDVNVGEGIEIVALALGEDHNAPAVSVHLPRITEEEAPAVAGATAEESNVKADNDNASSSGKQAKADGAKGDKS